MAHSCGVSLPHGCGCRAKASEALSMRCVDPTCPMRGGSAEDGNSEATNADLHEEDHEFGEADPCDATEE